MAILNNAGGFRSTVTPPNVRPIDPYDQWHVDPATGAIIGAQSGVSKGPAARFTPVDITQAQANAPTPAMISDLDATFRLNVVPYTRYASDGAQLVPLGGGSEQETLIMAGMTYALVAPLTISTPNELIVEGGVKVMTFA